MTKVSKKSGTVSVRFRMVIFRVTTGITILGMFIGGLSQFLRADYQVRVFEQLGYPLYAMSIIGLGKILGAISLSIPGIPLLFKTSAYAGLVFVTTGAVISHIVTGAPMDALSPLIVAGIAVTSCLLNPSQTPLMDKKPIFKK
ncbi:DoxX-like protein [Anseongella ginsenosidimutans]|uniref:DoxX-like protein n=1 Tax=Anseongella ginsenosidimutans TaxID=496056 RepID=A0A4R3KMD7_9SPHI|nr:DoxX family protein [Anseongella ginsenosidimutans]QEC52542.1 DoxX family protein [Anseongella ginsenosidimutans]TCS85274.1 DoxX-like protein [Anseongella ginsenosidimutans]